MYCKAWHSEPSIPEILFLMKNSVIKRIAFLGVIAMGVIVTAGFTSSKKALPENGFAVIELFTSEGCASCPPADELIAKIQKEYNKGPVYVLAYHVDYWNNAGWKDKYSSSVFTQRQLHYAQQLKIADGPYTPQAIINGTKEVIGSDEKQVRQALSEAFGNAPEAELSFKTPVIKNGDISLTYQTQAGKGHTFLQLALVQKNAVSKVLKGENKGRTLSHIQIVRNFQSIDLKGNDTGTAHISWKPGASVSNYEVIGFLQDAATGNIIAATKLPLSIK